MAATRVELVRTGARATRAVVGGLEIQLLTFAPHHVIPPFDVDRGYLVAVLDGAVAKTFTRARWSLARDSLATLPAGASHASHFGRTETRVLTVRCRDGDVAGFDGAWRGFGHIRASASTAVAARLAAELQASDESWPLAAEGYALQLLASTVRATPAAAPRRACWVRDVRDMLHERVPRPTSLSELAAEVGVHSAHLARSFRREYGVTVGEYARTLRLEWAAAQLAVADGSLAEIAVEAGFADQSHFTRSFRGWAGTTPGRYRDLLRR
jgi:AraC family transcriptional regulator